jgi:hypothetical protein
MEEPAEVARKAGIPKAARDLIRNVLRDNPLWMELNRLTPDHVRTSAGLVK